MTDKKLISTIEAVKVPERYGMRAQEINAIYAAAPGTFEIMVYCFDYGFLKGQRAAKAEARREKRLLLERDTSGWYVYLCRWLERSIDNKRLLELVGMFARSLEGSMKKRAEQEAKQHGEETG